MEYDDYKKLLNGAYSPSSEQNELLQLLMQFKDEHYFQYLSHNLNILQELNDNVLSQLAITLLLRESQTNKIFEEQELAESFLQTFLTLIPNIYQSKLLKDNIKMIVSTTLSFLAIKMYQDSEDTTIQQYVIQIFQSNQEEYETLTINCVMEIVIGCEGLGGFDENIISQFLVMPLQQEGSYIPRCKLYFGVVMSSTEDQELSQLFNTMYIETPVPEEHMQEFLNVVIAFSEKHGEFFEPHLSTFIPLLCEIAVNPENKNRNMPLFVFTAISTGAKIMCQTMEEFYVPVIQCLIQIMSEVSDENPVEYDPDNRESYLIACDQLSMISNNCEDSSDYFRCFEKICLDTVSSAAEESGIKDDIGQTFLHVPWTLAHAIVSAYCEFLPKASYLLIKITNFGVGRDYSSLVEFTQRFIPLLKSNQTVPSLRVKIMNLYSILSQTISGMFQDITYEFMFPIMREIIVSDESQIIRIEAATLLKNYFKMPSTNLKKFFPDSFNEILKIISQSPQCLYMPLIKCLSYFASLKDDFSGYFESYIQMLLNAYFSTEKGNIDLKLIIILSITSACKDLNVNEDDDENKENQESEENQETAETEDNAKMNSMKPILLELLNDIYGLAQAYQIDEYNNVNYYSVLLSLLSLLSQTAAPFALMLLPKTLEKANEDIQIISKQRLDIMERNSMFTEIQETQPHLRNFALNSDIDIVKSGLSLLISILGCIKLEVRQYLQEYIDTIQKWITNDYQIEVIKSISWVTLENLILLFSKEPEIETLMNIFFDDFNSCLLSAPVPLGSIIVQAMNFILSHKRNIPFSDSEKISESLVKLENFSEKVINLLHIGIEKSDHFTGDHCSRDESKNEHILEYISSLYNIYLNRFSEITVSYMEENHFIEKMINLLNASEISNPGHKPILIFAIENVTMYLCQSKNVEMAMEWEKNLFDIAEKCQFEVSYLVFKYMINLFKSITFPVEYILEIEQRFENFLYELEKSADNEEEEDKSEYSDWCLSAFAVLIMENNERIDTEDATSAFCHIFPIWKENEICDYTYSLIAELLIERNTNAFSSDNLYRILDNAITYIESPDLMTDETRVKLKEALSKTVTDDVFGEKVLEHIEEDRNHNDFAKELLKYGYEYFQSKQ